MERSELQEDWLTTMVVTRDLHSLMSLVLIINKNSSALGTVYYLDLDIPVPNYPNSYASLHTSAYMHFSQPQNTGWCNTAGGVTQQVV